VDVNATWVAVLEAWIAGDMETAGEHAGHLQGWLDRGGFFPTNVTDLPEFSSVMLESLAFAPAFA
jgi:hypothetical protein